MAGWRNLQSLHRFAYRFNPHRDGMRRLRDWSDRSVGASLAMWWAPKTERVTIRKGWVNIAKLLNSGPSPDVFTLQSRFDPPESRVV